MNDCLQFLEKDISLQEFLVQLETLSSLITDEPVDINKAASKNLLTAFMNHWRFASKTDAALLEGYFSIFSSMKFFTEVEKPFMKLLLTNSKNSSAKWVYRLFRMCCLLFQGSDLANDKSVLETKVKLIEEVVEKNARLGSYCIHFFVSTLNCKKADEIDTHIIEAIDYCCSNKDSLLLAGSYFLDRVHEQEQRESSLSKLVKAYLAILSASRKTPAQCIITAGGVLAKQAGQSILNNDLFPALSRAVKRNSEIAVPCMIAVVKSLKVDSSSFLPYLVDTSMYYFKQATPAATDAACDLLRGVTSLCSDSEAVITFSNSLLKEMDSARSNPSVKRQVYLGLRSCLKGVDASRMGKTLLQDMATRLQDIFLAALKKETNPVAKAALLDCIGQAVLAAEAVNEPVLAFLITSSQTSSNILLPALCALRCVLRVVRTLPDAMVVRKILESAIERAVAKPFLNGREGIVALPALVRLACCIQGESVPTCVLNALSEGSFFFQNSLYSSNNREDDLLVEACQTSLCDCVEVVLVETEMEEKKMRLIVKYLYSQMMNAVPITHKSILATVRKLATTRSTLRLLLQSYQDLLVEASALPFYNDEYPLPHEPLLALLLVLVHGAVAWDDLSQVAWCASHPFLAVGHHSQTAWQTVLGSMLRTLPELTVTDELIAGIIGYLHDEQFALATAPSTLAVTTTQMLENVCLLPEILDPLFAALQPELAEKAADHGVTSVTSKDLSIWQTPAHVEWKPRQEDSGYVPEVTTQRQKKSGNKGSNPFGKNDDKWAAELQAELNKDKIAKEKAEKAIAARVKALDEQAAIRAAVDKVALPYKTVLLTVRAMAKGAQTDFEPYLMESLSWVNGMLSNPLVCVLAREVFCDCTTVVIFDSFCDSLHNALYYVFYQNLTDDDVMEKISPVLDLTNSFFTSTSLSACYLPFYLPILRYIAFSKNTSLFHNMMVLLNAFSGMESEEEDPYRETAFRFARCEIIEILLELLRVAPRLDPSPESVLMGFCDAEPALQPREVLLLIGDRGMLSDSEDVRMNSVLNLASLDTSRCNPLYVIRLFMLQFDEDPDIQEEAKQQWEEKGLSLNSSFYIPLFQLLGHSVLKIRRTAGRAIAQGLLLFPAAADNVLLQAEKKCKEVEDMVDPLDREQLLPVIESIFYMLEQGALLNAFDNSELFRLLNLHILHGFAHESPVIRVQSLTSAEALMKQYGDANKQELLAFCNERMQELEKDAETEEEMVRQDHVREGCTSLLGIVASFLEDGDPRIVSTVEVLLKSLSIPAEAVQNAIARRLPALFKYPSLRAQGKVYIDRLFKQTTECDHYAERHGAALGLAGVIKGMGIKAMKEYGIDKLIREAAQSDKASAREGSLLLLKSLVNAFLHLFEPYVVPFLPLLFDNFSHKDEGVREASQEVSRSLMRILSPHGVKAVLPEVMKSLNDHRWRTKLVAIKMLGSMAYCSPQSFSLCLPLIVPVLTEACNNAQTAIQDAAREALQDIGNVIRTPEIADLQNTLIRALTEPHLHTSAALHTLTVTTFHHTVDAPSLSLIIPILMRGLNDRSTEDKKRAALIAGNICSLAKKEHVMPYLSNLLTPLKKCLMDPIPEVRAVAAHSIGMLGHEVGEQEMKGVLDWLMEEVYKDSTVAERSGAAQGLADLLTSVNQDRFDQIFEELINNARHPRACVREGVLWTLSFLPSTLGERFTDLIQDILPAIVSGLADESDMVAEVALRAGQVLVKNYARTKLSVVLPPIKDAMMNDDWRIRQSSIQLMGELLYTLGRTKAVGISESEDDSGLSGDDVEERLKKELGEEVWTEVMASLFYLTTDINATVRQYSLQVWKSVVNNTPRTLKKLVGELTRLCFQMFTSDSENKRTLAARCLGEIVQKLGEYVVPHVLEVLNEGLRSDDEVIRQIICIGFHQVLKSCTASVLKSWEPKFLQSLRACVCDESDYVRSAAADALRELQNRGSGTAIDKILPILLQEMETSDSARQAGALNGMKLIIHMQGRQVISILFLRLTRKPYSVGHMRMLQQILPSTSKFLHSFLQELMEEFLRDMYGKFDEAEEPMEDKELLDVLNETLCKIMVYMTPFGITTSLNYLAKASAFINNGWRRTTCMMLNSLVANNVSDWMDDVQTILGIILKRASDLDETVIVEAWKALTTLLTKVRVEDMMRHVSFIENTISTVLSAERYKPGVDINTYVLPAFTLKEGLKPLFLLLQRGIMVATADKKADCASLITKLVEYAPAQNVRPYALQVTGPLIRIVGDKYESSVRSKIFAALNLLLAKSGDALRPFLPQLQTTFLRALRDSSKEVRTQGGQALVHIVRLSNRIDNVVTDLSEDVMNLSVEVRETVMICLRDVMLSVGARLQPATRTMVEERMVALLTHKEEDIHVLAAGVLGVSLTFCDEDTFRRLVEEYILNTAEIPNEPSVLHGRCMALGQALKYNAERCAVYHRQIINDVIIYIRDEDTQVCRAGISVCKYILNAYSGMNEAHKKLVLNNLITELSKCSYHTNSIIRYETVVSISLFGQVCKDTEVDLLGKLVPTLMKCIQDSYPPVKLSAERALVYLLKIHDDPSVLENYLRKIPEMDARYLKTYVQRVLVKLPKVEEQEIDF